MKNAKFHNRLSDLIHSGFSLDENNKETFEVMNELESAAIYRIRPNWNSKDFLTDWSLVGGVPWQERKSEVMLKGFKKNQWYKKLGKE